MIAATLTMLFVFSGLFALAAIAGTWRSHGRAALAIGRALRTANDSREVAVTIRTVEVRATARLLRGEFRSAKVRPLPQAALPAAA